MLKKRSQNKGRTDEIEKSSKERVLKCKDESPASGVLNMEKDTTLSARITSLRAEDEALKHLSLENSGLKELLQNLIKTTSSYQRVLHH
jgi:hypothetical protein